MPLTPKELLNESMQRRSYRKFLTDEIDIEVIKDCIKTAVTAPNGADKQPWHFVVVTDKEAKKQLREKCEEVEKIFYEEKISKEWKEDLDKLNVSFEKPFLTDAPCVIIVFKENYVIDENKNKSMNYYTTESACLATGFLINALRNAGYVTLTYTPAPMTFLRDLYNRPQGETPIMVLPVGLPDKTYELPSLIKKSFEEVTTFV